METFFLILLVDYFKSMLQDCLKKMKISTIE